MTRLMTAALAATALGAGALATTPARADNHGYTEHMPAGVYVGGTIGRFAPRDLEGSAGGAPATIELENAWHFGGQVGYRFGNGLRIEGDVNYTESGADSVSVGGATLPANGDLEIWSFTAGMYYDLNTGTYFRPYAGAGIGAAYQKFDGGPGTSGDDSTDLTAFGEVGVGLQVADNVEIVPSYRYQWIDNGGGGFDDTEAHIARVGLRYGF